MTAKRIAICSVLFLFGASVAVIGVSAFLYKDEIIEYWHLRKLDSEVPREKMAAVETLGDLHSERAVPRLVEFTIHDDELGKAAEEALEKIGPEAVRGLIAVIADEERRSEEWENARRLLLRFKPPLSSTVPTLIRIYDEANGYRIAIVLRSILRDRDDIQPEVLMRALRRKRDVAMRCELVSSLEQILARSEIVLPVLEDALGDEEAQVRFHAAMALGDIGRDAAQAMPALIRALRDADSQVRLAAANALEGLGDEAETAAPALRKCLQDQDEAVAQAAALALLSISLTTLIEAMESEEDDDVRLLALNTLAGSKKPEAVEAIVQRAQQDTSSDLRLFALDAVVSMGRAARTAVPALVELARGNAAVDVRVAALAALGNLGGAAEPAIPSLLTFLGELKGDPLYATVEALGKIGRKPDVTVPALIKVFRAEPGNDVDLRLAAAYALAKFGSDAAASIPELAAALEDLETRDAAAYALGSMGRAALPALTGALAHEESHVRWAATSALVKLGKDAAEAIPALSKLLQDEDSSLRQAVAQLLGDFGPKAKEALPALRGALKDEDIVVRVCVATSMVKIDPAVSSATTQVFTEVLKGREFDLSGRMEILDALSLLGVDAAPTLTEALSDDMEWVRFTAATRLGELGAPARGAVPALKEALADEDEDVREAALEALNKIQGAKKDAEEE